MLSQSSLALVNIKLADDVRYNICYSVGSVFSLLSAKDREKLKRVSDTAKQVASGQSNSHTPEKEVDLRVAPESSTKSIPDSEYNHNVLCTYVK